MIFIIYEVTPLEAAEKIEAIRYLEVGKKIKMVETDIEAVGIDTPEDLENAIEIFKSTIKCQNVQRHKSDCF